MSLGVAFTPIRHLKDHEANRNLDNLAKALSTTVPNGWQTSVLISSFLNSWSALGGFQFPGYRIWGTGEVELFGGLTGGTSGNPAFVLSSNLAPAATRQWSVAGWDGSKPVAALIKIDNMGNVYPVVNSNNQVFLDGIRLMPGV